MVIIHQTLIVIFDSRNTYNVIEHNHIRGVSRGRVYAVLHQDTYT